MSLSISCDNSLSMSFSIFSSTTSSVSFSIISRSLSVFSFCVFSVSLVIFWTVTKSWFSVISRDGETRLSSTDSMSVWDDLSGVRSSGVFSKD